MKRTIIFLLVLIFCWSAVSALTIGSYIFEIDGNSQEESLRNIICLEDEETFETIADLERALNSKKQKLINKQIFSDISYSYVITDDIVDVTFNIVDADTFLAVAYPQYSDELLKVAVRIQDKNFFGSLTKGSVNIDYYPQKDTIHLETPFEKFKIGDVEISANSDTTIGPNEKSPSTQISFSEKGLKILDTKIDSSIDLKYLIKDKKFNTFSWKTTATLPKVKFVFDYAWKDSVNADSDTFKTTTTFKLLDNDSLTVNETITTSTSTKNPDKIEKLFDTITNKMVFNFKGDLKDFGYTNELKIESKKLSQVKNSLSYKGLEKTTLTTGVNWSSADKWSFSEGVDYKGIQDLPLKITAKYTPSTKVWSLKEDATYSGLKEKKISIKLGAVQSKNTENNSFTTTTTYTGIKHTELSFDTASKIGSLLDSAKVTAKTSFGEINYYDDFRDGTKFSGSSTIDLKRLSDSAYKPSFQVDLTSFRMLNSWVNWSVRAQFANKLNLGKNVKVQDWLRGIRVEGNETTSKISEKKEEGIQGIANVNTIIRFIELGNFGKTYVNFFYDFAFSKTQRINCAGIEAVGILNSHPSYPMRVSFGVDLDTLKQGIPLGYELFVGFDWLY